MFIVVSCLALLGVFMLSVMGYEFLMTSAISCPLWSSVYECQRVDCAFTSLVRTECSMFVMYIAASPFTYEHCLILLNQIVGFYGSPIFFSWFLWLSFYSKAFPRVTYFWLLLFV